MDWPFLPPEDVNRRPWPEVTGPCEGEYLPARRGPEQPRPKSSNRSREPRGTIGRDEKSAAFPLQVVFLSRFADARARVGRVTCASTSRVARVLRARVPAVRLLARRLGRLRRRGSEAVDANPGREDPRRLRAARDVPGRQRHARREHQLLRRGPEALAPDLGDEPRNGPAARREARERTDGFSRHGIHRERPRALAGVLDSAGRGGPRNRRDVDRRRQDLEAEVRYRLPKAHVRAAARTPAEQLAGFIAKFETKHRALIRAVRRAMRKRLPTANELVWDNYNFFVIGYSPTERPYDSAFSIAAAANGVGLSFLNGASLPDPHGLLQGSGSRNRFIRLDSAKVL